MPLSRRFLAVAAVSALSLSTPLIADAVPEAKPLPVTGDWGSFGIQTQWIDTAVRASLASRHVVGKSAGSLMKANRVYRLSVRHSSNE